MLLLAKYLHLPRVHLEALPTLCNRVCVYWEKQAKESPKKKAIIFFIHLLYFISNYFMLLCNNFTLLFYLPDVLWEGRGWSEVGEWGLS